MPIRVCSFLFSIAINLALALGLGGFLTGCGAPDQTPVIAHDGGTTVSTRDCGVNLGGPRYTVLPPTNQRESATREVQLRIQHPSAPVVAVHLQLFTEGAQGWQTFGEYFSRDLRQDNAAAQVANLICLQSEGYSTSLTLRIYVPNDRSINVAVAGTFDTTLETGLHIGGTGLQGEQFPCSIDGDLQCNLASCPHQTTNITVTNSPSLRACVMILPNYF